MTTAPVHVNQRGDSGDSLATLRTRRRRFDARIARRRWTVGIAKRLLPLVALALLSLVALWPELSNQNDQSRLSYRRGAAEPQSGQMTDATYHGVDARNRPYTMTATTAHQVSPERVDLIDPKGDMTLESGNWLMVRSRQGVYLQHTGNLDLSGDVHIYRDDGTTLTTSTADVDLKAGAAAGAEMTHAEGPFGTLDAQGFALTDKGEVIQFSGPGRLILNSAQRGGAKPAAHPAEPGQERAASDSLDIGEAPPAANVVAAQPDTAGQRGIGQ
jgi:lipopolysaccharide export system protein LptC